MYKIGEFSKIGQISIKTLRHYDNLGLLRPRHVDPVSQYRFYQIEQLQDLHRILALKEMGLSLEQILLILKKNHHPTADQLKEMLLEKQREIDLQIADWNLRLSRIQSRIRQLEEGHPTTNYIVVTKPCEPHALLSIRRTVPFLSDMSEYRCTIFNELYDIADKRGLPAPSNELMLYHNSDYVEEQIEMEACLLYDAGHYASLEQKLRLSSEPSMGSVPALRLFSDAPAQLVAATIHQGSLWELDRPIRALIVWAKENGYECSGPFREIHLFGKETATSDVSDVLIEMQIGLYRHLQAD